MSVSVVAEARVFPASGCFEERTAPLSILDATVANFTPTETVLAYDAPAPTPTSLLEALRRVLDAYPQWCGSLHCLPFDAATRHGRLALTWGRPDDPGVVFVEARCDVALASAAPARVEGELDWDPSSFPAAQLVPSTPLAAPAARGDDGNGPPRPAVLVQATTFTCGGLAIGLRLAHPLADAHALAHFVRDWAAAARSSLPPPAPGPLFDPSLLDARAAPQPPDNAADPLPCNRFDWWISNAGSPFPPVHPPAELLLRDGQPPPLDPPGTPMPWADWDLAAPVAHRVLHFPGPELLRLWQAVAAPHDAGDADDGPRISRLDALLGHIWSCVTRARGQAASDEPVTLDYTLGVRARLAPPLPDRFVGSPLVIAAATAPARDVVVSSSASRLLRKTVAAFTPAAVAGHVAEKMWEQSPQRLWQAFLGRKHLLVTSWIHTRLYEVEFGVGGGGRPRLVHAAMPRLDGLVQLMEAPPKEEGGVRRQETRHWADDGVDVQVYLAADTMEKLLRDPELRKYRG
ncbi:Putrescine hydroxycinnamoyltransferase 1 [Lasiodiplodia hormozganensis]|uniref:Putrescine hydroxycinnamoyltransferase 1 n=1 Tax=Lasiodiplodia hormozganensis TaxID=869390 RepID=A0AA39XP48_9PEZI|nr:Putrescine hydroxycinnamoyltransferase 1 [Lasiodiplodia hormozganensis]